MVKIEELQEQDTGESSEAIRFRIESCRELQNSRFEEFGIKHYTNSTIPQNLIEKVCEIGDEEKLLIRKAMGQLSLSARAYNKILKVSRTIADLDQSIQIEKQHLLEAIQYRSLDRNL